MPKEKAVIKAELIQENGSVKRDKFLCFMFLILFFFNSLDTCTRKHEFRTVLEQKPTRNVSVKFIQP